MNLNTRFGMNPWKSLTKIHDKEKLLNLFVNYGI